MQGQLFSQDFLLRGIQETPPWQALADAEFDAFETALRGIFVGLDANSAINEAQTEQLVIERVLRELGWADDYLPQVAKDDVLEQLRAVRNGTLQVAAPVVAAPANL